jgi:hypothetical protein
VEKEQRWRRGGAQGEHKYKDTARKQKRKQKKATVGEERKEVMMDRSTRIEKESKRRSSVVR